MSIDLSIHTPLRNYRTSVNSVDIDQATARCRRSDTHESAEVANKAEYGGYIKPRKNRICSSLGLNTLFPKEDVPDGSQASRQPRASSAPALEGVHRREEEQQAAVPGRGRGAHTRGAASRRKSTPG